MSLNVLLTSIVFLAFSASSFSFIEAETGIETLVTIGSDFFLVSMFRFISIK